MAWREGRMGLGIGCLSRACIASLFGALCVVG